MRLEPSAITPHRSARAPQPSLLNSTQIEHRRSTWTGIRHVIALEGVPEHFVEKILIGAVLSCEIQLRRATNAGT
jgi:hypothetical protein